MSNTVLFPTIPNAAGTTMDVDTNASVVSVAHHSTALEICDLVYGSTIPPWDVIERFYEPSAKYENPLITATSRAAIADINAMASRLSQVDVPNPAVVLSALFGTTRSEGLQIYAKARASRLYHHRRTIVEHTLHIVLLPGLQSSDAAVSHPVPSNASDLSISFPAPSYSHQPSAQIDLRDILYQLQPSPFHLRLPLITRLSFNDAGKITHHRDYWDVKDLLNLIPGMTLAQCIASRIFAQSIRGVVCASRLLVGSPLPSTKIGLGKSQPKRARDEEEGLSPAAAYAKTIGTNVVIGATDWT
ncbi:hypothetical protein SCP_0210090 [Sparassis crispa]|uniref:Uncharacterized protein n=1 Tax=Sparassis crispa TaxID=139825 RepID=A0A401GC88_9APHY|nr:hypothetical protein SCP_0210090 [Sparassis crispa]GBE79808.1 hypothetical protein SCP_0210090 [Sparassis crispa]